MTRLHLARQDTGELETHHPMTGSAGRSPAKVQAGAASDLLTGGAILIFTRVFARLFCGAALPFDVSKSSNRCLTALRDPGMSHVALGGFPPNL